MYIGPFGSFSVGLYSLRGRLLRQCRPESNAGGSYIGSYSKKTNFIRI